MLGVLLAGVNTCRSHKVSKQYECKEGPEVCGGTVAPESVQTTTIRKVGVRAGRETVVVANLTAWLSQVI